MSLIGQRVADRYVIERPLGSGSGGSVFAARDIRTGGVVAIKQLRAAAGSRAPGAGVLDLERSGLRGLDHPQLVRILDAGAAGEYSYIVTEYVPGGSLAGQRLPIRSAWQIAVAEQMLEALAYLHGHGILHGDVKTENILLASESPPSFKLTDFGLAQRSAATEAGLARGSPAFMAPEVIRGDPADERSDLYALGVTLYEIAFGELPFATEDVRELLLRHLTENPRRLAAPGPVDARLVALLRRLLAKEPAARPAEARAALALWRGEAAALPRFVPARLGMLLGRDDDLARLEAMLGAPRPEVVAVAGQPGVGKTRLLQELALRRSLQGLPVWWWSPFGLLGGTMPEATDAPESAPVPGDSAISGAGSSPRDLAARRAARIYGQLGEGPWLLLVDDADDAPGWFQEALAFLLREAAGDATGNRLVCVAGRENSIEFVREALGAGGFEAAMPVELGPWAAAELEQASAALLGAQQLDGDLLQAIQTASGGIPSEVESVCRVLVEKQLLRLTADGALTLAAVTSPESLVAPRSARLASQVARCTVEQREVLRILAVLRAPASPDLLAEINPSLPRELPGLQHAGLVNRIESANAPRFVPAHAGVRSHLVAAMADAERRSLHDRIATAIEQLPQLAPDENADLHRAHGSDLAAARAATARLAQQSHETAGPEVMQEVLVSLLQLWPEELDRKARQAAEHQLLDVQLRLGAYDEVHARVAAALKRSPNPAEARQWRNRAVAAHLARGEANSALDMLGVAPAEEDPETALLRARAFSQRSQHHEVLAICEPLIGQVSPEDPSWSTVIELAGASRWALGEVAQAQELIRSAMDWSEANHRWVSLASQTNLFGLIEFYQGRMHEAESYLIHAHALMTQAVDRYGIAKVLNSLAAVAGETGQFDQSREFLRQALDLSRALGETESAGYILTNLARLATTTGCYAEALRRTEEAIALSRKRGLLSVAGPAHIERGEVLGKLGAAVECHAELDPLLESAPGGLDEVHILFTWSALALDQGDHGAAAEWLHRARNILAPLGADDESLQLNLLEVRLHASTGGAARAATLARDCIRRAGELRLLAPRVESEVWLSELILDQDPVAAEALAVEAVSEAGMNLLECRWRAERVLGLTALARGDQHRALGHYVLATKILEEICAELPPQLADSYLMAPDRVRLLDEVDRLRGNPGSPE